MHANCNHHWFTLTEVSHLVITEQRLGEKVSYPNRVLNTQEYKIDFGPRKIKCNIQMLMSFHLKINSLSSTVNHLIKQRQKVRKYQFPIKNFLVNVFVCFVSLIESFSLVFYCVVHTLKIMLIEYVVVCVSVSVIS